MTLPQKVSVLEKIEGIIITALTIVAIVLATRFIIITYNANIEIMKPVVQIYLSFIVVLSLSLRLFK